MARDDAARDQSDSLLNRRGYLRLAGAAAASVASFGGAASAAPSGDLVSEGFEQSGYADVFTSAYRQGNHDERVTSHSKTGDSSLRVGIPEGSHYGIGAKYDPVEAGDASSELTELYGTYWVRFSSDFDGGDSISKLPGPANVEPGGAKGGDPATGTNGWSARTGFTSAGSDVEVGYYCYHMDMDGQYGDFFSAATVPTDQWIKIDQHVALNSTSGGSASSDGRLRMWIDDSLEVDESGMRFTEDSSLGCNYWFDIYYGGGYTSPADQSVYLDSWALNASERPTLSSSTGRTGSSQNGSSQSDDSQNDDADGDDAENDDSQSDTEQGTVFELVASDDMETTEYQFTVEGSVEKRTSAGRVESEGNDSIASDGGTATVRGATGNGYGDSYLVEGTVTSVSDIDESRWTLRYGGEEVSVAELTGESGRTDTGGDERTDTDGSRPTVESFETAKSRQVGGSRILSVDWGVSDPDGHLSSVTVTVGGDAGDGTRSTTEASGRSASGWNLFLYPTGSELDVSVRAKDTTGNVVTETETVTL